MIRELEKAISNIITEITASEELPVYKEEGKRAPKIITGFLPVEEAETTIPAIAIRTTNGKNDLNEKRTTLKIIIALFFTESEKGYEKLNELIERISKEIIETGVILEKYEILPDIIWEIPEEQPYPFWIGIVNFNVLYGTEYRNDINDWLDGK